MLNRDFASVTARIAAANKPEFAIANTPDLGMDFANAIKSYTDNEKKQKLINALQGGDPEQINIAAAAYDPQGQLDYIQRIKQARADADLAFQRQKEMADYNHALDMKKQDALYNLKNHLEAIKGGYGTAAMQTMAHLQELGFSPKESALLVHAGQNNAIGQIYPSFGKEGAKKSDQELGKNYAADLDEYNNMVSKMPELKETVSRLRELSPQATFTKGGEIYNELKKQLQGRSTKGAVAKGEYKAIIDNQILPLLRDTFGAQFTEKEGEALKATLGATDSTPEEKEAVLKSFINQKQNSIESKYRKLKSYEQGFGASAYNQTPSDDDAWGDI